MTLNAKTLCALLLVTFVSALALATEPAAPSNSFAQQFKDLGFHVGGHTEFYNAIQTDTNGATRKFDPKPLLGFSSEIELNPAWRLGPELLWVLPQGSDGVSKNLFMIRLDAIWMGGDWWRLRGGTSLMVNNIRGTGGSVTLENGGSTSEFYLPAESRTAINNTIDFGGELTLRDFAFRFQTYWYAPLKSDRRQMSYALVLSYYYDLRR
jgi:hypothetical protein